MNEKEKRLSRVNEDIEHHTKGLQKAKEEKGLIEDGSILNNIDLTILLTKVKSYNDTPPEIKITIHPKGEYTYILGGDGRSQAWDEKRIGVVCEVVLDCLIDWDQFDIVKNYINSLHPIVGGDRIEHFCIIDVMGKNFSK
jgi:hypothetical protein